jgi:hypothetical protein
VIVIHCRFGIAPKGREAWTESARRTVVLCRAEDGCIAYDFSFDVIDPDVAYAYEAWESQDGRHGDAGPDEDQHQCVRHTSVDQPLHPGGRGLAVSTSLGREVPAE